MHSCGVYRATERQVGAFERQERLEFRSSSASAGPASANLDARACVYSQKLLCTVQVYKTNVIASCREEVVRPGELGIVPTNAVDAPPASHSPRASMRRTMA